jgi:hypothetical protein
MVGEDAANRLAAGHRPVAAIAPRPEQIRPRVQALQRGKRIALGARQAEIVEIDDRRGRHMRRHRGHR